MYKDKYVCAKKKTRSNINNGFSLWWDYVCLYCFLLSKISLA